MPASRFNPVAYEKSLEDAGVNRAQAAAHAQGLADLHADFVELRVEMLKEFANFRIEMIKWMVGLSVLQTATTVTLIKLLT